MDVTLTCSCGEKLTRSEGSAGARLKCVCGRELQMPTLAELRRMSGEPEDPERLIRAGIDEQDLFPERACCRCDAPTEAWVPVMVECEPGINQGGFDWFSLLTTLLLAILLLPIGIGFFILMRMRPRVIIPGKGYRVPLLICADCQKGLGKAVLIECLRRVPVYNELLNKYPEATVHVVTR